MTKGSLIVISGFSGSGKGTLMKELLKSDDRYVLSVSATTRAPREGEEDGREYFFITKEEFEKRIGEDAFLEYARYVGNYYGTPCTFVEQQLEAGKDVLLEIDVQGGMQIRDRFPEAILLFIMTPSAQVLKDRLSARNTEGPEEIKKRLEQARVEMIAIPEYDYVIVNDDLALCTKEMDAIIRSAKQSPARQKERLETFAEDLRQMISAS